MTTPSPFFSENLAAVRARIAKACKEAGRDAAAVELIAVSKEQPEALIEDALAAGQTVFGENRVQDALARWSHRRPAHPGLRLHLIGPLQTNKVRDALELFDVIESVDRESVVMELARQLEKTPKNMQFFVQVNTGGEEQKSGVSVEGLPDLLALCRQLNLPVSGLMCIPPVSDPPGLHFALLKKLAARHGLPHLSMGMSGDYPQAIAAGATHIRVGTALFGPRQA